MFVCGRTVDTTAVHSRIYAAVVQMESLQEEIEGLRRSSTETSEQLAKTRSELTQKDEDMKSLQADSKRQLVEVYEMKYRNVSLIALCCHCWMSCTVLVVAAPRAGSEVVRTDPLRLAGYGPTVGAQP